MSVLRFPRQCAHWLGMTGRETKYLFDKHKKAAPEEPVLLNRCKLAFCAHLSEALAAKYGTVGLGLEGNLCLAAAACAGSGEELTGATAGVLTGVTAGLAALGLILEATLCVEFLLAGSENEFVAALFAN